MKRLITYINDMWLSQAFMHPMLSLLTYLAIMYIYNHLAFNLRTAVQAEGQEKFLIGFITVFWGAISLFVIPSLLDIAYYKPASLWSYAVTKSPATASYIFWTTWFFVANYVFLGEIREFVLQLLFSKVFYIPFWTYLVLMFIMVAIERSTRRSFASELLSEISGQVWSPSWQSLWSIVLALDVMILFVHAAKINNIVISTMQLAQLASLYAVAVTIMRIIYTTIAWLNYPKINEDMQISKEYEILVRN